MPVRRRHRQPRYRPPDRRSPCNHGLHPEVLGEAAIPLDVAQRKSRAAVQLSTGDLLPQLL